ncbi:MAG TPA: NAD(P)-dependent oxidoreductase [Candidatus Angelobacter sp.]|jgi:phosphonate dehydrogenase
MTAHTSPSKTIVASHRVFPETLAALAEIGNVCAPNPRQQFAKLQLSKLAKDADAFLAFMPDVIDDAWLLRAPKLRVIAAALKGHDNFDLAACTRRGVWVSNVPDLLTAPTSELTIGLMISLARKIRAGDSRIRKSRHSKWQPDLYGTGIFGSTVGLIGTGMIGTAIADRLQGFGATLLYFDNKPIQKDLETRLKLTRCALPELLARCDFLVLALPLNAGTYHLLNDDALASCKQGALLINPARGSVVDEAAVIRALESGRLGGYAADVFECEDWSIPGHPKGIPSRLLEHPATLFTPHLGSAVESVRRAIELRAVANIADWACGRPPRDAVNKPQAGNGHSYGKPQI